MLVGLLFITFSFLPLTMLTPESRVFVFPLAAFQGVGICILLNTATSCISDVIGADSENSAFVYGCFSFADKLVNGLLLVWIIAAFSKDPIALRRVMGYLPAVTALGAFVFTYIGVKFFSDKLS